MSGSQDVDEKLGELEDEIVTPRERVGETGAMGDVGRGEFSEEPEARTDEGASLLDGIAGNPVLHTLFAMTLVSVFAWTGIQAGNIDPFVLQAPLFDPWWGPVIAVYAHQGPGHLLANATMLVLAGGLISLSSSTLRFHLFFLASGALSAIGFVATTAYLGTSSATLGASGATFALVGYLLTANPASTAVLGRASYRIVTLLAVGVALVLTVFWSAAGSAYLAHFIGAVLGLLAGHVNLLRTGG